MDTDGGIPYYYNSRTSENTYVRFVFPLQLFLFYAFSFFTYININTFHWRYSFHSFLFIFFPTLCIHITQDHPLANVVKIAVEASREAARTGDEVWSRGTVADYWLAFGGDSVTYYNIRTRKKFRSPPHIARKSCCRRRRREGGRRKRERKKRNGHSFLSQKYVFFLCFFFR